MNIVVFGDVCLDIELHGTPERLAQSDRNAVVYKMPGFPVYAPGMAGNVALNLAENGHNVNLVSRIGADSHGGYLVGILEDAGVWTIDSLFDYDITTTKLRAYGDNHALVGRWDLDRQAPSTINPGSYAVQYDWTGVDAVIISDYAKGMLDTESAALRGIPADVPVIADIKHIPGRTLAHPIHPWYVLPNALEYRSATGRGPDHSPYDIRDAFAPMVIVRHGIVVTCGPAGAKLHRNNISPVDCPTELSDVGAKYTCGAGDIFAAAFTVALANSMNAVTATEYAVAAASNYAVNKERVWALSV